MSSVPSDSYIANLLDPNTCKTFFYGLSNAIYHIECEELISPDLATVYSSNVFAFLHRPPGTERLYQLACRKLSVTFISQLLNKLFHNVEVNHIEQKPREFSESDQKNLKSHLERDLACYLALNYKPNSFLYPSFLQDYYDYENDHFRRCNSAGVPSPSCQINGDFFSQDESLTRETNLPQCKIPIEPSNENEISTEEANLLSEDAVESSGQSGGIKISEETNSRPCKWSKEATELLLSYLKEHNEEVDQLAKTRSPEIYKALWEGVSVMLYENGHGYSHEQCSIKWKNIKKNYKDSKNGNNPIRYQSEVEEILGENRSSNGSSDLNGEINTSFVEVTGSKRKTKSGLLNEEGRPKKAGKFTFISENPNQEEQKKERKVGKRTRKRTQEQHVNHVNPSLNLLNCSQYKF